MWKKHRESPPGAIMPSPLHMMGITGTWVHHLQNITFGRAYEWKALIAADKLQGDTLSQPEDVQDFGAGGYVMHRGLAAAATRREGVGDGPGGVRLGGPAMDPPL